MRYVEYGKEHKDVILLLHGGGLSWWNYRDVAEQLSSQYRVILPILDGHSGSNHSFTTIADNAARIIDFIDSHFGGSVLMVGGLSLGGQILLDILSQRSDICRYALVESALVMPSKITHAMIRPAFGSCYGLIRQRWFSKLQFQYLRINPTLFEDYYRDTCRIAKADMIAFLQANASFSLSPTLADCSAKVFIFAGDKETAAIRSSAKQICQCIPQSHLEILPKLFHGEFSLNYPDIYTGKVCQILKNF